MGHPTKESLAPNLRHASCAKGRPPAYFDGGHFVLDEYAGAIAEAIIETFSP
jgi:hypothetical protein